MQKQIYNMGNGDFLADVYLKLAEAEKQVLEGKTIDAEKSIEKIKNKYL